MCPDDSWMHPRPTQQMSKMLKMIQQPSQNDFGLPSELPHVTPKTPNDNENKSQKCQTNDETRMSQIMCTKYPKYKTCANVYE